MDNQQEIRDEVFTEEQLNAMSSSSGIEKGLFYNILKQNPKQIKDSQASQLAEDLEFALRNQIINIKNELRTLYRNMDAMIDVFLPSQTTSLKIAEGFNASKFASDRISYAVEIRNKSIILNAALNEYNKLIGKDFKS